MLPAIKKETRQPGAFQRALERLRESKLPKEPSAGMPTGAGAPQEFFFPLRCAVSGFAYFCRYRRAPDDKLYPASPFEPVRMGAPGSGLPVKPPAIAVSEFALLPQGACPGCGRHHTHAFVRCGKCGEDVCTGRSYMGASGRLVFVCHQSCGSVGEVGDEPIRSFALEPGALAAPGSAGMHQKAKAAAPDQAQRAGLTFRSPPLRPRPGGKR